MSNDEKKFQPIFQILHIKSAWFLLELAMALVTTIGMRFLQVWSIKNFLLGDRHIILISKKKKYVTITFWTQKKSKIIQKA